MRKITQEALTAMRSTNRDSIWKSSNTAVDITDDRRYLYLFGNLIAQVADGELYIRSAGYPTNTTKERLNALPGVRLNQKKGMWYLNGREWCGLWTHVQPNGSWSYLDTRNELKLNSLKIIKLR